MPRESCPKAPIAASTVAPARYQIGQTVEPAPKRKLDIRPKSWSDDKARGPRGVFTNGGR